MAPFFSRLLPVFTSAYGLQAGKRVSTSPVLKTLKGHLIALALVFVPQANELWYDLGGGLGFVLSTSLSLYYPSLKAIVWDRIPDATLPSLTDFAPRQILCTALMTLWAIRLGTFLVTVSHSFCPRAAGRK